MKSKIFQIQNNKKTRKHKKPFKNISDTQNLTLASAHDSSNTFHILPPHFDPCNCTLISSLQLHFHLHLPLHLQLLCSSSLSLQFTSPNNHMSCSPSSTVRCSTMIWPSRYAGPLPARASWCNWLPNWVSSALPLHSIRKCLCLELDKGGTHQFNQCTGQSNWSSQSDG